MRPTAERVLDSQQIVPNLDRALTVLEYLSLHPRCGISEIADQLKMPKNTVFRILTTLAVRGYLERDESTKQYRLGGRLLMLGYRAVEQGNLISNALDVITKLRDQVVETVLIGTRVDTRGVVLEELPSPQKVKVVVGVGEQFPLHSAAPGKAMLAALSDAELEQLLPRLTLTKFNDRTITTRAALEAEIAGVREVGYAIDRGEETVEIHCVSAAVLDHHGFPLGAIWVTGPASRLGPRRFATVGAQVRAAADRISSRFGAATK